MLCSWKGNHRLARVTTAFHWLETGVSSRTNNWIIYYFLKPSVLNFRRYEILKTKQVRPQRCLLGGESAVEGDRISPVEGQWTGAGTKTVSLVSSVTRVIRLPISWTSSTAIGFHVPAVSMATGKKRWVLARLLLLLLLTVIINHFSITIRLFSAHAN